MINHLLKNSIETFLLKILLKIELEKTFIIYFPIMDKYFLEKFLIMITINLMDLDLYHLKLNNPQ